MYVPVPVFALFVILEAAALVLALYICYPGLLARLQARKASKPAPEQWMLITASNGAVAAWRVGEVLPAGWYITDPGPFTASEIKAMAGQ
jgi:hypothetical protein